MRGHRADESSSAAPTSRGVRGEPRKGMNSSSSALSGSRRTGTDASGDFAQRPLLSPLPRASLARLQELMPEALDYLLHLEDEHEDQAQRYEAKSSELLRSINVGQELIEQLAAVKKHCTVIAQERDTLQLKVGKLLRACEAAQPQQHQHQQSVSLKDTRAAHKEEISTLRAELNAHAEQKLQLDKDLFRRTLELEREKENLVNCKRQLEQQQEKEEELRRQLAQESARMSEQVSQTQFLTVSDARAVSLLLSQLHDELANLVRRHHRSPEQLALAGGGGAIPPPLQRQPPSASAYGASSPYTERATAARGIGDRADGLLRTPWAAPSGSRTGSSDASSDASERAVAEGSDGAGWAGVDEHTLPSSLQPSLTPAPAVVPQRRHDVLQWMMFTAQQCVQLSCELDRERAAAAQTLAARERELQETSTELRAAQVQLAAAAEEKEQARQRLATQRETHEAQDAAAEDERARLEKRVHELERLAVTRAQEADRELQRAQQRAVADREALVSEASLELGRLQGAQTRLQREIAQLRKAADDAAGTHTETVRALQERLAQLQDRSTVIAEERDAAVKEAQKLREGIARCRREADERLTAHDRDAHAHLQACQREWALATEELQQERGALRQQLDALQKQSQSDMDAIAADKLATEREAQQMRDALDALKCEVMPEQHRREQQLQKAIAAKTDETQQLQHALAVMQERLESTEHAQTVLREKVASSAKAAEELQVSLKEERQNSAAEHDRASAAVADLEQAKQTAEAGQQENKQLREALAAVRSQAAAVQRQVSDQTSRNSSAAQAMSLRLQETQQLLDDARKDHEKTAKLRAAAEERAVLLTETLKAAQKASAAAEHRVRVLQEQSEHADGAQAQRATELQAALDRQAASAAADAQLVDSLRRSVTEASAARAAAERRALELSSEVELVKANAAQEQQQQLTRLKTACDTVAADHEAALVHKDELIREGTARAQALSDALAAKERQLSEARQALQAAASGRDERARSLTASLESELAQLKSDYQRLAERSAAVEEQSRRLAQEKEGNELVDVRHLEDSLRASEEALQRTLQERDDAAELADAARKELRRVRESAAADAAVLERRIRALETQRSADSLRYESELQASQQTAAVAEDGARAARKSVAEAVAAERARHGEDLQRLQTECSASVRRLMKEKAAAVADCDGVKAMLKSLRNDVKAAHVALEEKEDAMRQRVLREQEARESGAQQQQLQRELVSVRADREALQQHILLLEHQCAELQNDVKQRTAQAREGVMQLKLLEESRDAQQRELDALRRVNRKLEARLEDIEGDRGPLRQQLHSLLSTD